MQGTATLLVLWASIFQGCASRRPPVDAIDRVSALETFDRAWSVIYESHFDTEFNGVDWLALRDELRPQAADATTTPELRTIIREMISRLGQSHFALIPGHVVESDPEIAGDGKDGQAGGNGQVGLDLRLVDDRFVVSFVEPGSSADLAGVRQGWILSAIGRRKLEDWQARYDSVDDGQGGRYIAIEAMLGKLAGTPGSSVGLGFLDATDREVQVQLERELPTGERVQIGNLPPFFAKLRRDEIRPDGLGIEVGLIHLNVWMPVLSRPFAEAVDAFRDDDGMIIDLRGNPGGIGAMVMGIAGHFLDERVALGTLSMRSQELKFVANPRRVNPAGQRVQPYDGPVAILTDELTASTSELFAGGMQDLGRARVFGTRSAGMALPAVTDRLPNDDVLYHAIANLTTASGIEIEQHGVVPDVQIPLVRSDLLAGRDAPLEAALRWIATESLESPRSSMFGRIP